MSSRSTFAQTLALHESFIRGLARGVLGFDDRVEDVLQETWRIALEKAPRNPPRLRRWLATVVRNRAISVLRRDATRRRHESARARSASPAPSAAEIAEREETRRRLVAALLGLSEPYRTVLLLRYYEGLGPTEIARRLEIPRETVRTRLKRGLARLRRELDEGGSAACVGALLPLAAAPTPPATWLSGVVLMKTKTKVALVLATLAGVAALVGWQGLPSNQTPRTGEGAARKGGPAAQTSDAAADNPRAKTTDTPAATDAAFDAQQAILLRGRLVAEKQPVSGVAAVAAFGVSETQGYSDDAVRGESSADGYFELDLAPLLRDPAPRIEVRVDHPDYVPRAIQLPVRNDREPDAVEIELRPGAIVTGVVLRPDGTVSPLARVAVYATTDGEPGDSPVESGKVNAQGRYRLRGASDGRYWVVAWEKGLRPAARVENLHVRGIRSAPPLQLRAGVAISGRLLVNGAPAAPGATMRASRKAAGRWLHHLLWNGSDVEHGTVQATVGPGGEFRVDGLAPGRYSVQSWGLGRRSHFSIHRGAAVEVDAPATGVEIRLETALLELEVRARGEPVPKARLMIHGEGSLGARTDDAGRYAIHMRPGLAYTIEVRVAGFAPHKSSVVLEQAGDERKVLIELEAKPPTASLVVRVRPAEGAFPAAITAGLFPEGESGPLPPIRRPATATGVAGVFRVDDLEPGAFRLVVREGRGWHGSLGYLLDTEAAVVLRPTEVTNVEVAPRRGGRLRLAAVAPDGRRVSASCRLRDPGGNPIKAYFVTREDGGFAGTTTQELFADGFTEVAAPLSPGRYTAEIKAAGYRPQTVELRVSANRTTENEIRLER